MREQFQLVAGHVALDFANTLDFRFDPKRRIELLPTYERFLAFACQSGVISEKEATRLVSETSAREAKMALKRAIELREILDCLFRAVAIQKRPNKQSLSDFNRFLAGAHLRNVVIATKDGFERRTRDLSQTPEAPLRGIIDVAAGLLVSPEHSQIRECGEPSCRWLFLDHSKNHSRRWCDMQICGNRAKVNRFRARQRANN